MEKIIKAAVQRGASDLHIKAGDVVRARINGKLVPLTKQRLTPDQSRAIALKLTGSEGDPSRLDRIRDFDCSWGLPGVGRFRVNVLRQRSSYMVVMRVIPFSVPSLNALNLPDAVADLVLADRGMLIVTGGTGSGKSSTVAALVHQINANQQRHIVTIENPIEFLHRDLNSSVTQREVGVDTESVEAALRSALRQDPDVIVVGEIQDWPTLETVIKAAETGHLVIATLPSLDATNAVERLLAMVPAEERVAGRLRIAEALHAVMAQQLLRTPDGEARIAAVEILTASGAVRERIREARLAELPALIAASKREGMQTFAQHVRELVQGRYLSQDVLARFPETPAHAEPTIAVA